MPSYNIILRILGEACSPHSRLPHSGRFQHKQPDSKCHKTDLPHIYYATYIYSHPFVYLSNVYLPIFTT